MKTRRTNFISLTSIIGKANLNLQGNIITNLIVYLGLLLKDLFNIKNILSIVKKVDGL